MSKCETILIMRADADKHATQMRQLIQVRTHLERVFMFQLHNTHTHIHTHTYTHQELADFERTPEGPQRSAQQLRDDLLAGHCHAFVALSTLDTVVGYLSYYYAYSTWSGRFAFVDDLYVTPDYQRQKIGVRLLQQLAKVCAVWLN